jgi:hypothetical protein
MPHEGFETTTPLFEQAKIVYALDCAATVIGYKMGFAQRKLFFLGQLMALHCLIGTFFIIISMFTNSAEDYMQCYIVMVQLAKH